MSLPPRKKLAVHPGQVLQDMLAEVGVSQAALARHLGLDPAKVHLLCHGKRGITADLAYRLGKAFKTGPVFWMNLEKNWELSQFKEADYQNIAELKRVAA
jgi:addiction module HigA family antidote